MLRSCFLGEKMSTICAIATAPGNAGISIIRISGEDSLKLLNSVFKKKTREYSPRYMYLGEVCDEKGVVDKCLAVYFPAPNSYTGEDMAEIHTHGGIMAAKLTVELLIKNGAVPAEPGEFSKRAFLNGKMDATQAEAVMDLIGAMSEKSARAGANRLAGALKDKINELSDVLTDAIAAIEAGIEYPEENLEEALLKEQRPKLVYVLDELNKLISSYDTGRLLKDGASVAIAGLPNVGKSSLLNRLLGKKRAIVTDVAGTTRDVISEYFDLDGIPVKFTDTAGIRKTADEVEKIGVERSYEEISSAAVVLLMFDAMREFTEEDAALYKEVSGYGVKTCVLLNKVDGKTVTTSEEIINRTGQEPLEISANTGKNVDVLLKRIYSLLLSEGADDEGIIITSARHKNALLNARTSLADAVAAIDSFIDLDCMSIDLRAAWQSLGEITGICLAEDIVDRIFTKFCLGK